MACEGDSKWLLFPKHLFTPNTSAANRISRPGRGEQPAHHRHAQPCAELWCGMARGRDGRVSARLWAPVTFPPLPAAAVQSLVGGIRRSSSSVSACHSITSNTAATTAAAARVAGNLLPPTHGSRSSSSSNKTTRLASPQQQRQQQPQQLVPFIRQHAKKSQIGRICRAMRATTVPVPSPRDASRSGDGKSAIKIQFTFLHIKWKRIRHIGGRQKKNAQRKPCSILLVP